MFDDYLLIHRAKLIPTAIQNVMYSYVCRASVSDTHSRSAACTVYSPSGHQVREYRCSCCIRVGLLKTATVCGGGGGQAAPMDAGKSESARRSRRILHHI